jgi:hypothetical protein
MLTTLRKFTVIFLAILQLIAPLVHAHTGDKLSGVGLHIPGLERYDVEHEASGLQAVSYDSNSEEIIVGIDVGMKDKQANAASDSDVDSIPYLHQRVPAFSPFDINFSPQAQQFVCRLFIPSQSPRAPPGQ